MPPKALVSDPHKCNGCGLCTLACALAHEGMCSPEMSRIHVIHLEGTELYLPVLCQHCEDAPCMTVCPRDAISRDLELDRVKVDFDRCISCRMCLHACPFGAIGFDTERQRITRCNLCDGDPQCVRFCFPGSLTMANRQVANYDRTRTMASRMAGTRLHSSRKTGR